MSALPRPPWAEKALRDECWALKRADDCEPEDAVGSAAFRIGQIVAGGALEEGLAVSELLEAATSAGMSWPSARELVAASFDTAARTPRFPGQASGTGRGYRPAAAWAQRPSRPRRWIWQGWIPRGTTTVLYGDGGTGKSLLAQQLATACATGARFLAHDVEPCAALCLFCEDDDEELQRRQEAINAALGVEMEALDRLNVMAAAGEDNLLMTFARGGIAQATGFGDTFGRLAESADPGLIVVDTVADTFGGNEVSRSEVRQFVSWLNRIAMQTDAAVLLLAHPSLTGMTSGRGQSGSTAWTNGARSHLYLSKPDDQDAGDAPGPRDQAERVLTRKKANYAGTGEQIGFSWWEGAFAPADLPKGAARHRLSPTQVIALRTLKMALDADSRPSPGGPVPMVRVTPLALWRDHFRRNRPVTDGETDAAERMAWKKARDALVSKGLAGVWGEVCWLAPEGA